MTLPLYQIDGWNDYFENAKSRTYDRCQYVVSPNKHGGSGWSNVMGEPDGAAIWGIWKMLLDVCSRQRKPREGWLTADGKKSGRRLTVRELSNQLRRPIEEIQRALQILQSPEVAFIRLADGQPETLGGIAGGYRTDTALPASDDTPVSADHPSHTSARDTAVSVEYPQSVSARDTESKKVTKKYSLSKGSDGANGADSERVVEGHSTDTERIADGQTDVIQHAEAKRLFGGLAQTCFGKTMREAQWPNDLEHFLSEALPLRREDWELIDWFYRIPESHPILNVTMRRQSFDSLVRNLGEETQKIRSARKKIGLNGLRPGGADEPPAAGYEPWTNELTAAAQALYGGQAILKEFFGQMPSSAQSEIRRKAQEVAA